MIGNYFETLEDKNSVLGIALSNTEQILENTCYAETWLNGHLVYLQSPQLLSKYLQYLCEASDFGHKRGNTV